MKPTPTFAKCSPAVLAAAFLAAAPLAALAAEPLAALTDPTHPAVDASLDIIAASITQDGGRLTFAMELRGPLPAALPARFRQLVACRTALIITHRFTTAMQADIIHVMDRGRVIESGSREELLAAGGRYALSWTQQMRGSVSRAKSE